MAFREAFARFWDPLNSVFKWPITVDVEWMPRCPYEKHDLIMDLIQATSVSKVKKQLIDQNFWRRLGFWSQHKAVHQL